MHRIGGIESSIDGDIAGMGYSISPAKRKAIMQGGLQFYQVDEESKQRSSKMTVAQRKPLGNPFVYRSKIKTENIPLATNAISLTAETEDEPKFTPADSSLSKLGEEAVSKITEIVKQPAKGQLVDDGINLIGELIDANKA